MYYYICTNSQISHKNYVRSIVIRAALYSLASMSASLLPTREVLRVVVNEDSRPAVSLAVDFYPHFNRARARAETADVSAQREVYCAVFVHANGMCRSTWTPTLLEIRRQLLDKADGGMRNCDLHVVNIDLRSHGASSLALSTPFNGAYWELQGTDVLRVCDFVSQQVSVLAAAATRGALRFVAVAHSFGATACLYAQLARPNTFASLLLIEPILFPDPVGAAERCVPVTQQPARGDATSAHIAAVATAVKGELRRRKQAAAASDDVPDGAGVFSDLMASRSLRRRALFPSRAAVAAAYASSPFFKLWNAQALSAYVDGGFLDARSQTASAPTTASAVELACPPCVEAGIFACYSPGLYARAAHLRVRGALTLTSGSNSLFYAGDHLERLEADDCFASLAAAQRRAREANAASICASRLRFVEIEGAGHLVPFDAPIATAHVAVAMLLATPTLLDAAAADEARAKL
jgi:pimeloyl-ACP methyl ester carboxylesterase